MDKKRKLAENAKAVTAQAGKFTLKGIKYAGIGLLSAADLATRGADTIIKSPKGRKLASKAAIIAACVAFPSVLATVATAGITTTAINYVYHNCLEGRRTTAIDAADNVLHMSDKVLEKALSIVAVPAHLAVRGIGDISRTGKEVLQDTLRNTKGNEDPEPEPEI